ncbi:DoxX family protein [Protaetiibacter sp. SSC-01]|uniref:DoxX family protein n=1 Tax=Protaetiibacter sp. SSC-01 TaxID=2759943 RepID=UPI001657028F|nr:DoxX family protein [Protaetiibacter sp. SSC-01]QNO36386.1 DoxX family protein [Protaetiibacter sp. SSC-01]
MTTTSTPTLSTPTHSTATQPPALQPPAERPAHSTVPARPAPGIRAVFAWVSRTEQAVLDVLARYGILALRLSLAFVYVAFGALKIVGLSPVAELVASMVPFLPADQAVIAMGVFEVVVGALLAAGVFVPWVAAAQVVHLLGTFLVFLVYPALTYSDGNPLALTVVGEFIAKNVVLIAGLFVVAAFSRRRVRD